MELWPKKNHLKLTVAGVGQGHFKTLFGFKRSSCLAATLLLVSKMVSKLLNSNIWAADSLSVGQGLWRFHPW